MQRLAELETPPTTPVAQPADELDKDVQTILHRVDPTDQLGLVRLGHGLYKVLSFVFTLI